MAEKEREEKNIEERDKNIRDKQLIRVALRQKVSQTIQNVKNIFDEKELNKR